MGADIIIPVKFFQHVRRNAMSDWLSMTLPRGQYAIHRFNQTMKGDNYAVVGYMHGRP